MGTRELGHQKQEYFKWKATDPTARDPKTKTALAIQLGVHVNTLKTWDKELENYDSEAYFNSRKMEMDKGIADAIVGGNATMARLWKALSGDLVEKTEVAYSLNADEIDKIKKKAAAEVGDFLTGIRKVSAESDILPD